MWTLSFIFGLFDRKILKNENKDEHKMDGRKEILKKIKNMFKFHKTIIYFYSNSFYILFVYLNYLLYKDYKIYKI